MAAMTWVTRSQARIRMHWPLLLVVCALFLLRVGLIGQPMTRDEGAYAYIATRLLAGEVPYRDVWDHKPPAVYFAYAAALALFGHATTSLHLLAAFVQAAIALLLFLVARRIYSLAAGYAAAILYALAALTLDAPRANTEIFIALCSVGAVYCFLRYIEAGNWRWIGLAGVAFGLGFFFKQVALLDMAGIMLYWLWATWQAEGPPGRIIRLLRDGLVMAGGFATSALLFIVYFWAHGALDRFWFDAFVYNFYYSGGSLRGRVIDGFFATVEIGMRNPLLWASALAAILDAVWRSRDRIRWFPIFWLAGSLLAVGAGSRFADHYYLQPLVPLSLLAGKTMGDLYLAWSRRGTGGWNEASLLFVLAVLLWSGIGYIESYLVYFRDHSMELERGLRQTVAYLQEHTEPDDLIFIWGKEPQVYFESGRRSASIYINYYALTRTFYVYPEAEARLREELTGQEVEMILVERAPANPIPPPPFLQELIDNRYQLETMTGEMEIYRLRS